MEEYVLKCFQVDNEILSFEWRAKCIYFCAGLFSVMKAILWSVLSLFDDQENLEIIVLSVILRNK